MIVSITHGVLLDSSTVRKIFSTQSGSQTIPERLES
jgi:hypothetical protein